MGLSRSYAISSSCGRTGAAPVRTNFVLLQSVMDTFGCLTIPVMIGGTVMIACDTKSSRYEECMQKRTKESGTDAGFVLRDTSKHAIEYEAAGPEY